MLYKTTLEKHHVFGTIKTFCKYKSRKNPEMTVPNWWRLTRDNANPVHAPPPSSSPVPTASAPKARESHQLSVANYVQFELSQK
jgi:hypothetical protein